MNVHAPIPREELVQLRGWIRHWRDDVSCGLKPTIESLAAGEAIADRVIASLEPPLRPAASIFGRTGGPYHMVRVGDEVFVNLNDQILRALRNGVTPEQIGLEPATEEQIARFGHEED